MALPRVPLAALVLALAACVALAVAPGAGAMPVREPAGASLAFDVWDGIWVRGAQVMVLRQFDGGQIRGIFGGPDSPIPTPAELDADYPFYEFRGTVTPEGGRVVGTQLSTTAGEFDAELEVSGSGFRALDLTVIDPISGVPIAVQTFRYYRSFGFKDVAELEVDRTWRFFRKGKAVRAPAQVGDVVRFVFDVKNLGRRGLEQDYVVLLLVLPKSVGNGVGVSSLTEDMRCARGQTASSVFVRCLLAALGPPDATAKAVVNVKLPAALKNKDLTAAWRLLLARKLKPLLTVEADQEQGRIKIRVLPAKKGGGSGGGSGGGGGGSGGGGGGPSQPPALTPVTDALMKGLVCQPATMGGVPQTLFSWGGYNPDIGSNFSCNYRNPEGTIDVGSIQAHYTRGPGGVNYCRNFDSDGSLSRPRYNIEVYVPPWFDNPGAIRSALLTRLENAGIALPCVS